MGWTKDSLLGFMQLNANKFGRDLLGIQAANEEYLCKRFTERLIGRVLDWTQVVDMPFVKVEYEGKGDVSSIKPAKGFCLTIDQCVTIANFIAGRIPEDRYRYLDQLNTFAILEYICRGTYIYKDWIRVLRKCAEAQG